MDDEFSLVDSQTVGTGYVINPNRDGSISHITDELEEDQESKTTISEKQSKQNSEDNEGKWNVFTGMFRHPSSSQNRKIASENSSRKSDVFEDHAPDNNDDVRSSSNPSSSRRLKNRSIPLNLLVPTNPKDVIDFVKDDKPSEMTHSRRIALQLMKYKWYYPNRDGYKSSRFDSSKAEHIDGGLQPSLEKAWAYFEHLTLPRFVYDGKKSMIFGSQKKLEIAESGERHLKTRLYHPFFTSANQLGDFGLGIALYFATLRGIIVVMVIAGLVSVPNLLYFASINYNQNQVDVPWNLKGSSACTDYEFVPCIDCNEDNFSRAIGRLRTVINESGETLVFGLKNNCNGATQMTVLTNLGATVAVTLGIFILSYVLSKQEVKFDEGVQTAQDYSIVIKTPPPDAHDPQEWKEFFEKTFDGVHVTCCTVAVHNNKLVKTLVQRREILQKIRKHDTLKNDAPGLHKKLLRIEGKIKQQVQSNYPVSSVFVTFETEIGQRRILKAFAGDSKSINKPKYSFRNQFQPLNVTEAAEPSAVRWQDLSKPQYIIVARFIIPYLLTCVFIVASTLLIRFLRLTYPESPNLSAYAISAGNFLFPLISRLLTSFEVHRREGYRQTSLYVKNAAFRWVNTAIVMTYITPFTSTIMTQKDDLLLGVYSVYFSEIVWVTGLNILDISENLKRHVFAPRAKTQEDMNRFMRGSSLDLADRYTTMTKVVILTVWYCSIYPACFFFGALALILGYITDKFALMRSWAPSPLLGTSMSRLNRKFVLPLTALVMIIVSSYYWTGFNFDNLCAVDVFETKFLGETILTSFNDSGSVTIVNITSSSQMYQYCDQSLLSSYAFPAIPSFYLNGGSNWMSMEQIHYTDIFGWTSLAFTAIAIVGLAYSIGYGLNKKFMFTGKSQGISFSSSGANAYIPEVKSTSVEFPLIACSVAELGNDELFEWASPYHSHDYYDLTLDAEKIMRDDEGVVSDRAFSKVRYWEPPIL